MPAADHATKPRPLRFSLRLLLGVVTLAAVFLAYPASIVRQSWREQALVASLARHEPNVVYKLSGPRWVQRLVGDDRVKVVHRLDVRGHGVPQAIDRLHELKALEILTLAECDLRDADIERIGVLNQVRKLVLVRTSITDRALATIGRYPRLQACNLLSTQTTPRGIKSLMDARELRELHYPGFSAAERKAAGLPVSETYEAVAPDQIPVQNLMVRKYVPYEDELIEVLSLGGPQIHDGHLQRYSTYGIQKLAVEETSITGRSLDYIARLPKLRMLELRGNRLGDDALAYLAASQSLEELTLGDNDLTPAGYAHLAKIPNLRVLHVRDRGFRNEGVAALAACPRLEVLNLHSQNLTSDCLATLATMQTLKYLSLGGTNVSNRDLGELAKLTQLERLNLQGTFIDEQGLQEISTLNKIHYLGLGGRFFRCERGTRQHIRKMFHSRLYVDYSR